MTVTELKEMSQLYRQKISKIFVCFTDQSKGKSGVTTVTFLIALLVVALVLVVVYFLCTSFLGLGRGGYCISN